jgi:hypothetical protein
MIAPIRQQGICIFLRRRAVSVRALGGIQVADREATKENGDTKKPISQEKILYLRNRFNTNENSM